MPSSVLWDALLRSLALAGTVAAASSLIGCAAAWFVTRSDLPGARRLGSWLALPYAIPAYLLAMAWVVLGNPTVGWLKDWLPGNGAYSFWGMAWVETTVAFAFPYLELKSAFERLDPSLEESARMSGAGPLTVFRKVSFPLLWPNLLNGASLAFAYAAASFGVPALLGLPARKPVLTTLIYQRIRTGGEAGLYEGLWLSAALVAISVSVLGLANFLRLRAQRRTGGAISGSRSSRPSLVRLGGGRWPAALGLWGFFAAATVLPWLVLGISALSPISGDFDPSHWTLRNLETVLGLADFQEALFNSLLLGAVTATLVTTLGWGLAYIVTRPGRGARFARGLIDFLGVPFSAPGTVVALLLIIGSSWATRVIGLPDEPLLWLAVAYGLKFSAIGARGLENAFKQIHPSLDEAARVSGANAGERMLRIWIPLLKTAIAASWMLAFLPMLTELTMSVLLTGPGAATLGTVLFQLQDYADPLAASALAWLLLTAALGVTIVATALRRSDV